MKSDTRSNQEMQVGQLTGELAVDLDRLSGHRRVFNHLDWWSPVEWVNSDAFSCISTHDKLAAALLTVPVAFDDINRLSSARTTSAWLRWCAIADGVSASRTLKALFEYCETQWIKAGIAHTYCIIEPGQWFGHYLLNNGYSRVDEVVTMICRESAIAPIVAQASDRLVIRRADYHDLTAVADVDNSAFDELWRFPIFVLNRAIETSAYFTVAEVGKRVLAYQMTAFTESDAHITRLAVHPDVQRFGIGRRLLADTMAFMKFWYDVRQITLNTQASNRVSQRLYEKFGFVALNPRFRVMHKAHMG
jgi:ribosomal-protein-alanine N-acetyltransferase